MAHKTISSLLAHIFILGILLALSGQAKAARGHPKTAKAGEMKQPEWLISDRSLLIPGIGRVLLPPGLGTHQHSYDNPYSGSIGGTGAPGSGYPGSTGGTGAGGDDTFVNSPGYEVPNPDSGSLGVPESPHP